jgi:hypothetical protein
MPDTPRHRFSLSDTMILIAALAFSLVLVRYVVSLNLLEIPPAPGRLGWFGRVQLVAISFASPVLITLSLAFFVISLRPPRPPLRCLAREPGFVAMAVVVATTLYYLVHLAMRLIANYYSTPSLVQSHYIWISSNLCILIGLNIAVGWFILALQGNWTAASSGPRQVSTVLGTTWIGIWVLDDLCRFTYMIYVNYF